MSIGEINCLKSSIKQMLEKLNNKEINQETKDTFIKNELEAMLRLLERQNKNRVY